MIHKPRHTKEELQQLQEIQQLSWKLNHKQMVDLMKDLIRSLEQMIDHLDTEKSCEKCVNICEGEAVNWCKSNNYPGFRKL